jgi:pimeloyl-ACP methyl ester carboxylesterase
MDLNHHRAGQGEPLVLIHGIGHHWEGWQPVIDRLVDKRDVIAIDLPGFGRSRMPPPGTPPGIVSLTDLVSEFLTGLGVEHPHVAGNSLGGWISLELAKRGAVRTATGLSPAGFQSAAESRFSRGSLWVARRMARALDGRAERVLGLPGAVKLGFGQLAAHPERIPAEDLIGDVHALANAPWFDATLVAITNASFVGGEQIHVPVRIAWGAEDRLLLPRQADRARRAIPGAEVTLEPGWGHVPFHDDPDGVARVLLAASARR